VKQAAAKSLVIASLASVVVIVCVLAYSILRKQSVVKKA
jgi:ABC-type Fe3+ transport system permease subunit